MYTGDRTVVIFGGDDAQKLRAAEALSQVNGSLPASERLPPPDSRFDVPSALGRCSESSYEDASDQIGADG